MLEVPAAESVLVMMTGTLRIAPGGPQMSRPSGKDIADPTLSQDVPISLRKRRPVEIRE